MKNQKTNSNIIEMKNITKKFGNVVANDGINFDVKKGEIHALLGENGAGKSTLMNILYGMYPPTEGEIYLEGKKVRMDNPNVAIEQGIGMVHQHFMLIDTFTVVENIILGMEPEKGIILDMDKARKEIIELSEKHGLVVDPDAKIQDISVGMQQRVEILKALYRGAEILILDEPTAVLTPQEIDEIMKIMRSLSNEGITIIIITHKLKEIKAIADRCTVIRRGLKTGTVEVKDVTESDLAEMMVGREVEFIADKKEIKRGRRILEINGINIKDNRNLNVVNELSLDVYAGEILGVAGIDGNGQSELIEGITGLRNIESGEIIINGTDITNKTPYEIIKKGINTIPEDRQRRGLILDFTIAENMILENYHKEPFSKNGILNHDEINIFSKQLIEEFDVRPKDHTRLASQLSGGNQQKVIIAREVTNDPDILIAAQPTRGLDVGAIEYVHRNLIDQRNNGKAVILVSFDLDEILNISDRIAVIYEGKIIRILNAKDTDEREIGLLMAGGDGVEE